MFALMERFTILNVTVVRGAITLSIMAAASTFVQDAMAQSETTPAMTSDAALAAMPDPQGYALMVVNEDLKPDAVQAIAQMLQDAMGQSHFFGAVYAYLPEGSTQLSIRVRNGLHSPEVADRMARQDCEAERSAQDTPCRLLATVLPEDWDATTDVALSSDAVYAFAQNAPKLKKPLFLARSRDTTRFAIWSGENTRQSALDGCNDMVQADGAEPDCEVVIDDRASSD